MSQIWNSGLDFLCGLAAGWSQIITGQPLDFIKTKLQLAKGNNLGFVGFGKQIFKDYGLLGFYRGSSSLFYGFAFTIALEFAIYQRCKQYFMKFHDRLQTPEEALSLSEIALSGSIVGIAVSFIYCPIQYAKLMRQTNEKVKQSSIKILWREISCGKINNIFKGMGATLGRETFGSALYYSGYEFTVRSLCKFRGTERRFASYTDFLMGGSVAGLVYWIVSYPWDVIKTRAQVGESYSEIIKNIRHVAYRGFGTVAVRSVIVNAFSFATFEQTKSLAQLFRVMTEL